MLVLVLGVDGRGRPSRRQAAEQLLPELSCRLLRVRGVHARLLPRCTVRAQIGTACTLDCRRPLLLRSGSHSGRSSAGRSRHGCWRGRLARPRRGGPETRCARRGRGRDFGSGGAGGCCRGPHSARVGDDGDRGRPGTQLRRRSLRSLGCSSRCRPRARGSRLARRPRCPLLLLSLARWSRHGGAGSGCSSTRHTRDRCRTCGPGARRGTPHSATSPDGPRLLPGGTARGEVQGSHSRRRRNYCCCRCCRLRCGPGYRAGAWWCCFCASARRARGCCLPWGHAVGG